MLIVSEYWNSLTMFLLFWNRKRSGVAASAHSNAQRLLSIDIKHKLDVLHRDTMRYDISLMDMHAAYRKACDSQDNSQRGIMLFFILLFIMIFTPVFFKTITFLLGVRCFLPNNNLVWEATRPVDCNFCRGVSEPLILQNLTREEFAAFAYSSQPIIIKNGCKHWRATNELTFDYLKELYKSTPGALDENCPFLNFRSNLKNLRDVFNMPSDRVNLSNNQQIPWFVGWSNCHPVVLEQLRKLYPRPHFLPKDAEMPKTDYIFLGYEHDAFMHLDYIPRLLWQAQLKGNKSWILAPTPECDPLCQSFSFYVEPGDAVLVDTRIWYHGTSIPKGQFALTIQSEYG